MVKIRLVPVIAAALLAGSILIGSSSAVAAERTGWQVAQSDDMQPAPQDQTEQVQPPPDENSTNDQNVNVDAIPPPPPEEEDRMPNGDKWPDWILNYGKKGGAPANGGMPEQSSPQNE